MDFLKLSLLEIMGEFNCSYAIAFLERGTIIEEFGNIGDLKHRGVIDQYFLNDPPVIFGFIEGKIMPQIVSQGCVTVVICNPKKNMIIGVAANWGDESTSDKAKKALELYRWAGAINHRLKEKLSSV